MAIKPWTWTELWPYAVLISVLISWTLFRLLAPKDWRDWTNAGVLGAFVIALYTEMYGFPLTIYFLAGILPLKVPLVESSGHLWATLLGLGRGAIVAETLIGYSILLAGALLIVKGWVKIHFSEGKLVNEGVYSLVRHPQYLGIFLVILGELVDWPTIPALVFSPVIVLLYVRLAKREERALLEKLNGPYLDYRHQVPMFVPSWRGLRRLIAG